MVNRNSVNRKSVVAACGAVIAVLVMTAAASGSAIFLTQANKMTFTGPVALPGVTLAGGTYIFEQLSPTSPDVIRVWSKDRSKVYYQAFTVRVGRPAGMPEHRIMSFGEAANGAPAPITAWYPVHSSMGHRFVYDAR